MQFSPASRHFIFLRHKYSCRIWGFHSGDYEECRLLGCGSMKILCEPMLRRNVSPPPSGYNNPRPRWLPQRCFPPKLLFTQDLHSATSKKTAFFTNIRLSTLFSNTLNLCSSLNVRDQVSHTEPQTKHENVSPKIKEFHVGPAHKPNWNLDIRWTDYEGDCEHFSKQHVVNLRDLWATRYMPTPEGLLFFFGNNTETGNEPTKSTESKFTCSTNQSIQLLANQETNSTK
jgi:hypothetical protein